MDAQAGSGFSGFLNWLGSPPVLVAALVILAALMGALVVARTLRLRYRPEAARAHPLDRALQGAVIAAPIVAGIALLLAGRAVFSGLALPATVLDRALELAAALLLIRLAVYALALLLGPGFWVRTRQVRVTAIVWSVVVVAHLGWLDVIQSTLNHISLVPGRSQFSLWALLKGLVVVTAFVVVASLIARTIESRVMRLDQVAVSTRVGVSKFSYFLLVGLGMLLGVNAAGVDVTTLNVLTGAIGLGLGFGLQAVASNFVSGFVLLMDKSIKPGDVISFTGLTGANSGHFGWVQELRGRYVVVRDRDGVDTLVPNQNLITSPFINWSYSDQRVRLKLPVTVSYDDDPEIALRLLVSAAANHPRILRDPAPVSRLISFEDNGMRLEIRFWIADPVNGVNNVRSDVNRAIWRIFREHGVRIPVPQQENRMLPPREPRPPAAGLAASPQPDVDRAAD
ncbi:MAG: mechanosensitive ion channel [Proteobacteria bacterium]|nr:mechanosensitive ion channel [Pseudomonadota bacterium]